MKVFIALAVLSVVLAACGGTTPTTKDIGTGQTVETVKPDSESGIAYVGGDGLPQDVRLYTLSGTVIAGVESLTRQTAPAQGSVSGYGDYTSGYYIGGYYVGPSVGGKSFIRLHVTSIDPKDTDWITAGNIAIVKGTDTKMLALLPGDNVQFLCRRQAEAVAAIHPQEWYSASKNTTWELDYCRLLTPVITVEPKSP